MARPEAAAFVTSIANTAWQLSDNVEVEDKSQYPTIHVEYENTKVVIRREGSFTLTMFM
ncbi:hypothetical protein DFQ28_003169 [Apophysomyces sp. BC1034]|nr:hypothetical protein DFQ30_011173 [Apophysomyces sp. BC1015]KAG0179204.1 hypothetical protein DFQ29_002397 [Apophysomyces sp. BC1021]KAG0189598.1 hypothetical protein DFQ28_003169 [Apophysomyces sp. BC1034]